MHDNGASDDCGVQITRGIGDERAVDLQLVKRQPSQVRQRREPGTEIVQGETDTDHLKRFHLVDRRVGIRYLGTLDQF